MRRTLPLLLALVPFALVGVFAQQAPPTDEPPVETKVSEANQACLDCHDPAAESGPAVHVASLQKSPHKEADCTDCHSSFTPDAPHTKAMLESKVSCGDCHSEAVEALAASVHGDAARNKGDVPTCVTCHAGADPHAVSNPKGGARKDLVKVCSTCHGDEEKMARNHVDVEAVSSYEASFHGKALLRFDKQDTAVCMDCHTAHGVKKSSDPASTVNVANVAKTCGQAGCHVGATQNFANSGFSHLHLAVKEDPILGATELFFKVLTFGVLAILLLGIAFDMRVALFGPKKTEVSPTVAVFIALSFLSIVASITLAVLNKPVGLTTTVAAVVFAVIGVGAHLATKGKRPKAEAGKLYPRFTASQRIQHFTMIISFTALVVTGMPIRYPKNDVLRGIYMAMGGMDTMRLAHRIAAVVLIVLWIYHTIELFVRWKRAGFSFESWTMWPRKRDLSDVASTVKYHLGMQKEPPSFDRFQFREKFDYFAVYWGMPIMVFSGLILWFPVYFGAFLPKLGIPLAYIAHADEAVLAFLTIVTWHIYNTHFKPGNFPMNPVFITGTLPESVMEEEHGDELARLKAQEAGSADTGPAETGPEPTSEPQSSESDEPSESVETPTDDKPQSGGADDPKETP
ncbi:MAG: cytochrome b/b6 domain-containing protein [Armatimonadetes bacterium]|nr:cytochrome b/b6 domain-containing protein [Armatimonadota bacterium]